MKFRQIKHSSFVIKLLDTCTRRYFEFFMTDRQDTINHAAGNSRSLENSICNTLFYDYPTYSTVGNH